MEGVFTIPEAIQESLVQHGMGQLWSMQGSLQFIPPVREPVTEGPQGLALPLPWELQGLTGTLAEVPGNWHWQQVSAVRASHGFHTHVSLSCMSFTPTSPRALLYGRLDF